MPHNAIPSCSVSPFASNLRAKPHRAVFSSVLLAALACGSTANAADFFWDPSASNSNLGFGAGIWNATNENWFNSTDAVWPGAGNRPVFGNGSGGPYDVTVAGNFSSAGLLFNTSGYSLSAAAPQTLSSSAGVSLASGVTATIGSNVTFTRGTVDVITTLSGEGGILNIGSADQTSTDAKYINTQSGSTGSTRIITISGATTVNVNSGGYLGQNPATVYNTAVNPNGIAIIVGNSATGGSLVVKDGGNVTVGNNTVLALGSNAAGSGTLTIEGGQINAGGVTIGISGSLPTQALYAGLRFGTGTGNTSGTRIANLNGGTLTVGQVYAGTGSGMTNTFNFNGGTLQAAISNTTFMTGLTTAIVQIGGAKIDTNSFDVTIGQVLSHDAALDTVIDGGLTKNGAGTLTLTGANTFTGTTIINAGIISLGNAGALQGSALDVLNSIAGDADNGLRTTVTTMTLGGIDGDKDFATVFTTTSGGYSGVTSLTLAPGTGVTNSYSGIISDGASGMTLIKSGAGTQILSGDNSYTGNTTISTGALNIRHANALGTITGSTSVALNQVLQLQGGVVFAAEPLNLLSNSGSRVALQNVADDNEWTGTISSVSVSAANSINISSDAGLLTLSGGMSSSGAPFLLRGAGNITISGQITGATGVTSSPFIAPLLSGTPGIRVLANTANNYTGLTTVSGGTLSFSSISNANGTVSSLGAPANATSGTIAIGNLVTTGTLLYTGTGHTTDRVLNLAGTTGGATIDQSGASGLLKLTGDFTATGLGDKTLTLQGSTSGSGEIAGAIVDSAGFATSLTKDGTGTWTFSGNNTYTGPTNVTAGTLALKGSQASAITLATGTVLQLDLANPVTSSAALTFSEDTTVNIVGSPAPGTSYNLFAATSISGTPTLSAPIPGFALSHTGTTLQLIPAGGASDTTPPVITVTGPDSVSVDWGSSYTDAGATATDETAPLNPNVTTSGTVNTARPGVYILTYTATDSANNPATATRTVTVTIANSTTIGADGYTPLMRYALGAVSPSGTFETPVTSATATQLSLTAVVRTSTDDPKLTVLGTTNTDLTASGAWTTTGVTVTPSSDPRPVPAGCTRNVYTVDITGASKKFLRIEATLAP